MKKCNGEAFWRYELDFFWNNSVIFSTANAFSAEDCYGRLDSYMKRTLKRQRCPTDLLRRIEKDLESFFDVSLIFGKQHSHARKTSILGAH